LPVVWKFSEVNHVFHNHHLGPSVRRGYHALALNETRAVFEPVLWESRPDWPGQVEQVWFRGAHGDVGGQLSGDHRARPLANIPLVWMLGKAEAAGLPLPPGWRARFPCDPLAPMVGNWRGWGKIFLERRQRIVGRDPSERIHPSALPVPPAEVGLAVPS
ncbi:MAG: phospholipase effector Tle1 domain-containing protein, partial [Pararhodobacter sp.]